MFQKHECSGVGVKATKQLPKTKTSRIVFTLHLDPDNSDITPHMNRYLVPVFAGYLDSPKTYRTDSTTMGK